MTDFDLIECPNCGSRAVERGTDYYYDCWNCHDCGNIWDIEVMPPVNDGDLYEEPLL